MADLDQLLAEQKRQRDERDKAAAAAAAAQEHQKRLSQELTQLARVLHGDEQHLAEEERLQRAHADAAAELRRQRDVRDAAAARLTGLLEALAQFTDPREAIERMKDRTPILMMPVRLETRFKTVEALGRPPVPQLWLRIYPDDCWIDSFHPTLTETEVRNATAYWAGIWQAGTPDDPNRADGFEEQERGAWAALVTAHGSGRAAWITQEFQPDNMDERPTKANPHDVILTIATHTRLDAAEAQRITDYWTALWLADGDATKAANAQAALEALPVGAARATELVTQYVPVNFDAPLAPGLDKRDVAVSAAIVVLPVVETKQSAWSHAPKATILPDRFVFIGYQSADDTTPVVQVGRPVASPLAVAPDPSAPIEQQLRHDDDGNLLVPEQLQWLCDFDRAVEVGMGLRIDLTPQQATNGFHRVLVIGLRVAADEQTAQEELETLIRHHSYSGSGIAVVPQGTPTNNTDAVGAGHGRLDDPDASFDDLKAAPFTPTTAAVDKPDGQWLAEYLGIDPALFEHTHAAGATDRRSARAMNTALWPATLGYWMESMMSLVFYIADIEQTRDFFTRFVVAGGAVPTIRIGWQPYGILPTTTFSRMDWFESFGLHAYLRRLYPVLLRIDASVREVEPALSFVAKSGGDPHKLLADIVGLHPGSVEWSARYAESLATLQNRLNLLGTYDLEEVWATNIRRHAARIRLGELGYQGEFAPPILDLVYSAKHLALNGGVVDDQPLSETTPIRAWTTGGQNYLQWLFDASRESLDALYKQQGFNDNKPPHVLLYLWLRHALQLGYHDISVKLHEGAGLYTPEQANRARQDDPFLHIRQNQQVSESRYQPLYARARSITGDDETPVHQFIATRLNTLDLALSIREQRDALKRLKDEPTGRLERAFADHVDCCAYRLDAWLLGLVNFQLEQMRNLGEDGEATPRRGIHLGAYAWLEALTPEDKVLDPVRDLDPDLIEHFGGEPPLVRDSTNQGYVHAPSLNHAVAAAVLRNGFISNASPDNPRTMAVNLTSERVRTALAMLEGIRGGQSLSDLLGYQLERGLHDSHNLAEIDDFIYKLRKAFPLRADRLESTKTPEGVPIETIEARNVVNGLALVEHIKATGNSTYPFGKPPDLLPPTKTPEQADAINDEVQRLRDTHDAVADLALSEGVYQAVLGNYDRVASTYDAYARGNFPPQPDVVRTPLNATGLTHRVAVHLEAGADPTVSPIGGVPTPRAMGEPALNRWLATVLPAPDQVGCVVEFQRASTGLPATHEITLAELGLEPADWVALIHDGNEQAMTELDDRILRHAVLNLGPRPDVPVTIRYMDTTTAPISVFELLPLVRNLRKITTKARPLQPTDLTLTSEATSKQDSQPVAHTDRLELVSTQMDVLRGDLATFAATFEPLLADLDTHRADIVTAADATVDDGVALLERAARFAVPAAGWGFAYDMRRRVFAALLDQCAALVASWNDKLARYTAKLADAAAATTDPERFDLLAQAELEISTAPTLPRPTTPALYLAELVGVKQPAFEAKKAEFDAIRDSTFTEVSTLLTHVRGLLPVDAFDDAKFDLTPHEDEIIRFTQDMASLVDTVIVELHVRLATSQALFNEHDAAAAASPRVGALDNAAKALLGNDFQIIPEFVLTADQGDELANALAASRAGKLFEYLTHPAEPDREPFPVDTWLYGVARVRERMHAWEQAVMYAEAFGSPEPELDAMQLPFATDDRWLGLEFPPDKKLDTERLLYTAHFAVPFDKTTRQCGLLIDDWTETIPATTVDTGITFHHDRPNTEAPQTMLLVTPSAFQGMWRWDDLVDALNETLDLAKRRAVEPRHVDASAFAPFVPATVAATQVSQLTIALILALNNKIAKVE